MLSQQQLRALLQELAHERVLSVYVDGTSGDPGNPESWRLVLANALRDLRASVTEASSAERADLERCLTLLDERLESLREVPPVPGWVAFITASGVRHAAWLPAQTPTRVSWMEGPSIAPYVRALKEHRPVIVAVLSTRQGRLYRYERGRLVHLDSIPVQSATRAKAARPGSAPHQAHGPGARGQTGADAVQRVLNEGLARMVRAVVDRLLREAGDDGWIVIGGAPKATALAARALPPMMASRAVMSNALPVRASVSDIRAEAARQASALRRASAFSRIQKVAEGWGADERGTMGFAATQRALGERSVEQLLVSTRFLIERPADAESAVRAALGQGALIEVVSGEAAAGLDARAGGIAAQLRFALAGVGGAGPV